MILPYGIKEIVCPMLNKNLNEYTITCPLHLREYLILADGYERKHPAACKIEGFVSVWAFIKMHI